MREETNCNQSFFYPLNAQSLAPCRTQQRHKHTTQPKSVKLSARQANQSCFYPINTERFAR